MSKKKEEEAYAAVSKSTEHSNQWSNLDQACRTAAQGPETRIESHWHNHWAASGNPYLFASFTHLSYTRYDMDILSGKSYDVIYQGYDIDIPNENNLELHILVIYFLTFGQIF